MNSTWGNDLNYMPDYWPLWLIIALILVGFILLAVIGHAVLRFIFKPEMNYGHEHKELLYPKPIRIWHWCNAALFILLVMTGICMHFTLGPTSILVCSHKIFGFALIAFWVLFLWANAKGNGRHYKIKISGWFSRCWKQVKYYLFGIMTGKSHPFVANESCKFNPIQQVAYVGVMYVMLPLLLLSGLAVTYPALFAFGQQHLMFISHQGLAIVSVIFMIVHIYLCTTGDTPTQTFKCMVDGYHRHLENNGAK